MKGKLSDLSDKNLKKIKIIIGLFIAILLIWLLIVNPLIKFNKAEKQVMEATKRYFEINSNLLPTGKKVRTVTLQKLYDKDLISEDLKSPYTSKECDAKTSWGKVRKEDNEYKYYAYLKCGILSSKVDHKGPEITLKGNDIVTIEKGEKYEDLGVKSVVDDTDGNISISKVTIDTSKVNTNKNGTYEVTYKVKDSFNNETVKIRTVKVQQILDQIVEKDTKKTNNAYKGFVENNYIKLDGIIFKIVGLNDDGSVKVVSKEPLSIVDYNNVDEWLNEYFYNKFSDSAKDYIKTNSKWCNEKVSNPENYTTCNSYSKKKAIGLLSVADINNSKGEDNNYNIVISSKTWTSNISSSNKTVTYYTEEKYTNTENNTNLVVYPVLNIKKDSYIVEGNGNSDNPYVLKNNSETLNIGDNISDAKVGEYINYSGYIWRVIEKESDGTTKIIMEDAVSANDNGYYTKFTDKSKINYNTNEKGNIGYKLNNELTTYVNTKLFDKKKANILNYTDEISYSGKTNNKTYSSKLHLPSMYDLFSSSLNFDYWFGNYSSNSNTGCLMTYDNKIYCGKYNVDSETELRIVGYLNEKVIIKSGNGTSDNPYTITK